MTSKLTFHAQRALEQLQDSWGVNQFIQSDAARNDAHCPSQNNPNADFNAKREYYLGSLQVCHAGDTLNSYCQSIFAEIIKLDEATWLSFDATVKEKRKVSRETMTERLFAHRATDRVIREYLRDAKICHWPFESEVIALLRNKFVHQSGHDPKREVEQLIASQKLPWCPICVDAKPGADAVRYIDAEWLDADVELGQWACAHIRAHIHAMDQNLCYRFNLPRERWRPRPISRQLGSLASPRPAPEKHLPPTPPSDEARKNRTKQEAPDTKAPVMNNIRQEEIDCAKAHRQIQAELLPFIDDYIKETGVRLLRMHGGLAGNALPHTIRGHELSFEYDLIRPEEMELSKADRICIRLRQRDFVPYVTAWSGKSLMRDFTTPSLNDELKEHIRDLIDMVITR